MFTIKRPFDSEQKPVAEGKYIAYYRVSTDRQGRSGLGLDAQRRAVEEYFNGGSWQLVAEYTEVESGKSVANRPELQAALAQCRKERAKLVIAKLDRLGRNVAFIASLMESHVEFLAVDNPHASRLVLHIMAAFAEHEREQISQRTRAALAGAKARGVRLGNPKLDRLNRPRRAQAEAYARELAPVLEELRGEGITTVRAVCDALNQRGVPTASGRGQWHLQTVQKLLDRVVRD